MAQDRLTFPRDNLDNRLSISCHVAEDWECFKKKEDAWVCVYCQTFLSKWPQWREPNKNGWKISNLYPSTLRLWKDSMENSKYCSACTPSLESILQHYKKFKDANHDSNTYLDDELFFFVVEQNHEGSFGWWRLDVKYANEDLKFNAGIDSWEVFRIFNLSASKKNEVRGASCWLTPDILRQNTLPPIPLYGQSTGNVQSSAIVKRWYEECVASHPDCKHQGQRKLPTRLLKFQDGKLKLCLGAELRNDSRYATLSHCWGTSERMNLVRDNFQEFLVDISLTKLCRTFQNALCVLGRLDLHYIWIDSLCIIQDDAADWGREAVLMQDVYGFSDLTIAAASSTDGDQGCFHERNIRPPVVLKVSITNIGNWGIIPEGEDKWIPVISDLPLSRRAWVFQERILSHRIVYFTDTQLVWKCLSSRTLECQPNLEPYSSVDPIGGPKFWIQAIQQYSACDLTYASDKLVAISGVAKKRYNLCPDKYVAGFFRKDLEDQLCWYHIGKKAPRQEQYTAPSWSWACVSGPVIPCNYVWYEQDEHALILIKILDIDITLSGPDPMGAVSKGALTLSIPGLFTNSICVETHSKGEFKRELIVRLGSLRLRGQAYYDILLNKYTTYVLLPVRQVRVQNEYRTARVEGLIIRPTSQRPGEYERIGFFRVFHTITTDWKSLETMISYTSVEQTTLFTDAEGVPGAYIISLV